MSKQLVANTILHTILTRAGYKIGKRRRDACQFVHPSMLEVWVKSVQIAGKDEDGFYEVTEHGWGEQVISLCEETE